MRVREVGSARVSAFVGRVSADPLVGLPAVVIPLGRAVVCGEDHVYDSQRFAICPNCAAEDRLQLADLLANRRFVMPAQ
jgi:hypothetical protein